MSLPRVVVVGAGHGGFQTAVSLRQLGFSGELLLLSGEHGLPYQRPPLSKEFLLGDTVVEKLAFRPARFYTDNGIELISGDAVENLDLDGARVQLESGRAIGYDRLVLATGAGPRPLAIEGSSLDGVVSLRSLQDAVVIDRHLAPDRRLAVIGGGFIGLEVAAAARERGVEVTVLEALPRTLARVVTPTISERICAAHRQRGTEIRHCVEIRRLVDDGHGHVSAVELKDQTRIAADVVIVGVGAIPNVALADRAGLECADGVVVDDHLQTSDDRVWAIGDCASFVSPDGQRQRLESVQNATDHARAVAAAICGASEPYEATPWFWTFQHDCRVQIAGLTAGYDTTVARGAPESGSFSVFCFADERLLGAESVNRPRDHIAVRKLLDAGVRLTPEQAADETYDLKSLALPAKR